MANRLICGDAIEELKKIPDESIALVLTDPPYNIGVTSIVASKTVANDWDKIDGYVGWCIEWLVECQRVLKPNGVLYFWHNDMAQIAQLLTAMHERTKLEFVSFCIWDKGDSYRAKTWMNRDPDSPSALRSWFSVCEYCLHFFNTLGTKTAWDTTGLRRVHSNPECFKPLKDWHASELKRLNLTEKEIGEFYTKATGKKPHMLRHYFQNSQFEIPTEAVWNAVYRPLGFGKEYEELRKEYEELRNVHHCDAMHCNIWHVPPVPSTNRLHTCQKPVSILRRLIRVSSNPGDTVLDCFMGSGSTGVAAMWEGRDFIGIERDRRYYDIAERRLLETAEEIEADSVQIRMEGMTDG